MFLAISLEINSLIAPLTGEGPDDRELFEFNMVNNEYKSCYSVGTHFPSTSLESKVFACSIPSPLNRPT